ncbi:MAG: hypothetical protein R3324_07935 [Halobacteriales archaeon]|nr:hypothetical protein [Halobacteriales archaeon]
MPTVFGDQSVPIEIIKELAAEPLDTPSNMSLAYTYFTQFWDLEIFADNEVLLEETRWASHLPADMKLAGVMFGVDSAGGGTPTVNVKIGGTNISNSPFSLTGETTWFPSTFFTTAVRDVFLDRRQRVDVQVVEAGDAYAPDWTGLRVILAANWRL